MGKIAYYNFCTEINLVPAYIFCDFCTELNLRLKALAFDNGIVIKKSKTFSAKPEKKTLPIDNVKKEKNPSEWDLILKK